MATWRYDTRRKVYVDANGDDLTEDRLVELRDAYIASMDGLVADYTENLDSGAWTMRQFEDQMRSRLKTAYIAEYVLGRGGSSQMTPSDWGRVGAMLRGQYGHLRSYLNDLVSGEETTGTATNRARNFLGSARSAFSVGRGRGFGLDLPAHPGDGGTPCHGNCRCSWRIEEDETEWRATWQVSSGNPCDGCLGREEEWSPFVQTKTTTVTP